MIPCAFIVDYLYRKKEKCMLLDCKEDLVSLNVQFCFPIYSLKTDIRKMLCHFQK